MAIVLNSELEQYRFYVRAPTSTDTTTLPVYVINGNIIALLKSYQVVIPLGAELPGLKRKSVGLITDTTGNEAPE